MQPLKILMIVDSLGIGGTETHTLAISKELIKRGHTVVVGTSGGPLTAEFIKAGIVIEEMSFQNDNPLFKNYTQLLDQLRAIIDRHQIDLIHTHLIAGLKVAVQVSQERLIPIVHTAHGMFYPWRQLQSLIDNCEHVIAVSHPTANWIKNRIGYPQKQISIIPNGIDVEHYSPKTEPERSFRRELGVADSDFLVTTVSRIAWGKTQIIEDAIAAVEQLQKKYKNLKLAVVGSGPDSPFIRALAAMVNKRHDQEIILMTGALLDPLEAYRDSDLIIGTARVALEAMSCEKPVIAAGNSGYVGLITPDNFMQAWKVYFGDHDFLAYSTASHVYRDIESVLTNTDISDQTKAVRKLTIDNFSVARVTEQIEAVYLQVLNVEAKDGGTIQELIIDLPEQTSKAASPSVEEKTAPEEHEREALTDTPAHLPLVSVVIPTYNRAEYLHECLQGLYEQTYRPLEIVVIDDCSTDHTADVIRDWRKRAQDYPAVALRYHKLPRNVGFAHAVSIGYFLAQGEFIANHDSDDISHPERIEKQVRFLLMNNDYDLVGTNYESFTTNIKQTKKTYLIRYDHNIIKCYREGNHCVCFGSVMFRRQVLDKIGGLTTYMVGAEDYEYIARAITQGFNVQNLRSVLYYYRSHDQQRSREFYSLRSALTSHEKEMAP